jgi:YD repeat-containing protein
MALPDFGSLASNLAGEGTELSAVDFSKAFDLAATAGVSATISGPESFGAARFLPSGQALPYKISFENPPTASAIPGSIEVISRLDAQLDARTFRLGDINIGDIQVHIPEGRATFQGDFDFTRSKGFILRVTAGVDVDRSIASWLFEAIDPLTGEVIRDTTKGLLAPNNALGIGQGSVGYTILPRTDALTGDAIAANARVLFNTAAPQDAPQITQTLDAVAPKTTLTAERIGAAGNDYQLRWTSIDDDGGSGVRHATVYVAEDGGDFRIWLRQTSETAAIYAGREGHSYEFLALATDNAGNREQPPPGALAPDDGSRANLGSLPTFETTPADPPPPPAELPATNPLFVEAAKAVPSTAASSRPSEFRTVLSPFAAEAFATGIRQSFADIGTLAIVRLPDGSFLASGGRNRGELYRLSADGGVAGSPLIRLDVPIFDLALDANGRLWATTGGGALLELDPASGAILAEHGDGITQALAIHPESGKIYVSTGGGVAIFDPATGIFEPFSETRVDDLAFSPTGELWGTSWPERGTLVQFSPRGRGQAVVRLDAKVDSLAFGRPGSALAGLLFVTTNDGELEMIDLATFQHLSIAQGGSRGENVMATTDGALLVAQSHQIDRIAPRFAPRVVGTNPPHLGAAALPLASLTVTFDQDMAADDPSQTGSVLNLANYTLTGTTSGAVAIRSASYDAAARSVTLRFDPLAPDSFALHVAGALASRLGATLGTAYNASFTTTVDLSSHVRIDFLNTRSSRADGTVSYDVRVTNIGDGDLLTPIVLALDPARYFQGQPVNADGPNALGLWLIKLEEALADGALHPGESTLAHTVTVSDPLWQRVEIGHGVYAVPVPNAPPVFESTPLTAARAGEAYAYTALASDPGGGPVSYLLQSGPQGMAVDALTGVVAWTPTFASPEQANVVLRAYDRSGAYASQSFTIALAGVNHAPQILDLPARIEIDEGQLFEMPLVAADADGDRLTFFADNLPGGAVIDAERQTLAWTPGFAAAGDYRGITLTVSDGLAVDRVSFDLTVRPVDQAPTLLTPPERTVREGDPIRIQLAASDPEGAPLYYSSRFLPGGSFLDPHTGEFEWTPGFTQAGTYHIPFSVGDGTSATSVTATITVLNVNGLPEFDRLGEWQVREGQTLFFRAFAFDPENPSFVPQDRLPDGLLTPLLESEPTVTYTAIGLPVGATFDTETAMFVWTPGFMQAGTYTASFTASDDGDGTGASGISTLSVPIRVLNANQAPDVPEMANRTLNRDEVVEVPVVVTDADGNALTLSAAGLPAFATFTDNGGGRGVFRFAPGATDRGDHVLTVTATDDGDGGGAAAARSSTRSFVVSVSVPNEAPQLAWIGDKVAVAGETLSFNVRATDVEENPLTFSFDTLPAGATLTPQDVYGTALFTWTPTAADLGSHALTLRIADDGNAGHGPVGTDAQTLRVVVRSANQAPVLQPVGDHTLSEGDTLVLPVLAVDPDGDPLTFSATNLPAGASLDPQTGVLRWTPNLIQAGDYDGIVLSVSDGHRSDSETIALQVVNRNQAPVLTPLADQSTRETAELSFTLIANDFDGDPIAYASVNPLPAGARFDGRSATFTWTPNYDQAGEYRLSFLAQDPDGTRDTVDVTVRVDNLDRAPTLAVEKHQARIGEAFRLALTASDPDHSTTLVYRAKGLPDGATLDPATGVIEWTPGVGQAGDSLVLVTVSDGELSTTEPLVLRASLAPAAPSVTIEQTPSFAAVPGQPVVVHVLASSFAPIATRILTVNGLPVALDSTGTARLKAGAPGRLELVATATDADGLTSTTTSTLRVRDPLDSAAPVAVLDSALHSARLSAPTELRATVADSNLDEWRLELLPFSPEPSASTLAPLGEREQGWGGSILATGNGSVTNNVLTTLDTGKFANGIYKLRLTARDMAGRVSSSEALIEIAGAAKPGQFVRRETDLAVTLDGVALDLVREYDSLATGNAGSFGPGWRLALRDLDLQTDVPATGREASGVANPFSLGTRVYLTLPTGERVGFTFTPEKHELPGISYYTPAFTADAGVTWTLNAIDSKLSLAGNRLFDLGTGLPYNPALAAAGEAQLVLKAPDGTAYHLDAAHGVTAIVASSGKRLVVSDSGIVAANGDSVRFVSNADGQLASISGPGGERIVYGYDGEGRLSSVRRIADSESTHYGYEVGPAGRLSIVTGAHDLAIDYGAATPVVAGLTGDLGAARSYLATPFSGDLTAGAVDRLAFALRPSEFASTASGSIYLGVVVEASDGSTLLPGTPVIEGLTAIASSAAGGRSFALYALTPAEGARVGDVLHLLRIAGMDAATAGAYSVQVFVAGDANGDTKVDGSDAAIVAGARGKRAGDTGYVAAADANRDGVIDGVDSGLLFQNLGYAPNRPPGFADRTVVTHQDLEVAVPVVDIVTDPEGDTFFVQVAGGLHGTARISFQGDAVVFTPDPGYAGAGSFEVRVADGYGESSLGSFVVTVSAAELLRLDFSQRRWVMLPGQNEGFKVVGDFADQTNVPLPLSYVHVYTTDPEVARIGGQGTLRAAIEGTTVLVAERNDLSAATPVTVGLPRTVDDIFLAFSNIDVYPNAVALAAGDTRHLSVTWGDPNLPEHAADGVRYFASDRRIADVSSEGVIRARANGLATVTAIFKSGEAIVPVRVSEPVEGPTSLGPRGGIVRGPQGHIVYIGPNQLATDTTVRVTALSQSDLTAPLPSTMDFVAAFDLDVSGGSLRGPLQVAVPIGAKLAPGEMVYFFQEMDLPLGGASDQRVWVAVESGQVGADGYARTSSPPWPGLSDRGRILVAHANVAVTTTRFTFDLSAEPVVVSVPGLGLYGMGGGLKGTATFSLPLGPSTVSSPR